MPIGDALEFGLHCPAQAMSRKPPEPAAAPPGPDGADASSHGPWSDPLPEAEARILVALFDGGHHDELQLQAAAALQRHPQSGFAWKVLGASLLRQGGDALPALRRAAELLPGDAEAHNNLGNALRTAGHAEDAADEFRTAIALRPGFAPAWVGLGNALRDLSRLEESEAAYRQAVILQPEMAAAHAGLGRLLQMLGRLDEAVAGYRRALERQPRSAEVYNNLGTALQGLDEFDGAEGAFRQALAIAPGYANAHANLGNLLAARCRFAEARASYERALELASGHAEARNNLGALLRELGRPEEAVECFRRAVALKPDYLVAQSNLVLTQNYCPGVDARAVLAGGLAFDARVTRGVRPYGEWNVRPDPVRRLRVGWISGDLREHPVAQFAEPVISALAADFAVSIEQYAYYSHPVADAVSRRIAAHCRRWTPAAGLSDEELAGIIHADAVDILIDLSGHTAFNRLPVLARRPAPVQASWLGYPGTTGMASVDYLIADACTLPPEIEAGYAETIWRLPDSSLCCRLPDAEAAVSPLPASTSGALTFGSCSNLAKLNHVVIALWSRLLHAVPDSRLLLKTRQLADASVRTELRRRFAAHGIAEERLILLPPLPRARYLDTYHDIDIALDPFPYPGVTTTAEALWMGVPVLTLAGDSFVARQGAGLLTLAGLPDWIAADGDDYVACAVRHAGDLVALSDLRARLRDRLRSSVLFDAPRFAANFHAALRGMWARWCDHPSVR